MTEKSLSVEELARRCAEETDKFNHRHSNDPRFCFELLRRALAEDQPEAFTYVYQTYERQVIGWVYSHSRFAQTGESAEFFAYAAMRKFYFALRGEKFNRFPDLPRVLTYLKSCVHTEVMQYLRDHQSSSLTLTAADEVEQLSDLNTQVFITEIWARIQALLPDERDRQLARCAFFQDLKPRQIVTAFPLLWSNERDVTLALYRIRRVLRNDSTLRQLLGQPADD